MKLIQTISEMQKTALDLKRSGKRIGFVPTMGFLHEGHLSLVDEAKKFSDIVVMSIFVNPTQFGPGEDFADYPRDLERDKSLAEERGVDILFYPAPEDMYPEGDQTVTLVTEVTRGLCGPFRPGHFRGVTTVVAKLFLIVQPDVACFGEKDYQQFITIRRMVRDLHFPIQVVAVPTLREEGGLAMSSRNTYLDEGERREALRIFAVLKNTQERLQGGERDVATLQRLAREDLTRGAKISIEYLEIVDPENLTPLETISQEARILLAVRLGGKRLIDNLALIP